MNEAETLAQAILNHLDSHTATRETQVAALAIVTHTLLATMRPPTLRAAGAAAPRQDR